MDNIIFNSNHYPGAEPLPVSLRVEALAINDTADGITIVADFLRDSGSFYTNLNAEGARAIAAALESAADDYDRLQEQHSKVRLTVEVPTARAEDFKTDVKCVFGGKVL